MTTLQRGGGTCLLVIDLQVGVVADAFDRDGVLGRTAALIDRARTADVPVVFVQHQDEELVPDTAIWQFAAGITPAPGETVVAKEYQDSFAATTLAATLADLDVSRLVVAGAASDFCIRATVQRAAVDGYDVTLVKDCHTTGDSEFDNVKITGQQIVAHTNLYMTHLSFPDQTVGVAAHDEAGLFA